MLQKNPKPTYRRYIKNGAKILFVAEAAFFAVSYGVWYRLNREQSFRQYMHEKYPSILEGYYKVGEFLGSDSQIKKIDSTAWNKDTK